MPAVPRPGLPGEWAARAACKGYPVSWWFPVYENLARKPARVAKSDAVVAMRICVELCPVKAECLVHALRYREVGVWGGTSDRQRRGMRPRLRRSRVA